MTIDGRLLIGTERVMTAEHFKATDPARRVMLPGDFAVAGAEHVQDACRLAEAAFDPYRSAPLELRAKFLEACAAGIDGLGEELLERAGAETGLPRGRLEGERTRTVNQLKLFAQLVRQGDWLGLRVDHAQPERKPMARSDLRLRNVPLGPVAVFGASNFPLAFSAGGGDVASALAAGCPVIVKAHRAHPGTSALVAGAIAAAAKEVGVPAGVYSHLSGAGNTLGTALVSHPSIQAVGFTGSRSGGMALLRLAQQRAVLIPVYAEMSSVNPVVILPAALEKRAEALAKAFVASLTLGVGQFCTNPGLVVLIESASAEKFIAAAGHALADISSAPMLSEAIHASYETGVSRLTAATEATLHGRGKLGGPGEGAGALFSVSASDFIASQPLGEEVFGPSALVVRCHDAEELMKVIAHLEGQLTATLHIEAEDYEIVQPLLPLLERKAGRLLVNGWPTGVEVAPAIVHGGPFPATSAPWTTSVGTLAIERFLRPVCYQDFPPQLLPEELRPGNSTGFRCMTDGGYR